MYYRPVTALIITFDPEALLTVVLAAAASSLVITAGYVAYAHHKSRGLEKRPRPGAAFAVLMFLAVFLAIACLTVLNLREFWDPRIAGVEIVSMR